MELVDRLASDTAYTVVLPNFYRDVVWPDARYYKWENQGEVRERNRHCYTSSIYTAAFPKRGCVLWILSTRNEGV